MSSDIDVSPITAVHLDAVGGVAGDMFVAALVDAIPALWTHCTQAIDAMAPPDPVTASVADYTDGVLSGRRFEVGGACHETGRSHGAASHHHAHWRDIRQRLETAALAEHVRSAALGIFSRLAEAEASVHAIAVDDVAFHEVGAWDSIIDIVASAAIVAQLKKCRWSVGPLPRGRGLVRTAHGLLPVPAPATVELLRDYVLVDDDELGERITPTGAAILNYLGPVQEPDGVPRRLQSVGYGFGTRKLQSRSNMLRATVYGDGARPAASEKVEVLRFEVDDQSPEDLAIALDHLRATEGVLDVCQWPVTAKKGRLAMAVQIIVTEESGNAVVSDVFDETTTLGVRRTNVRRETLDRSQHAIGDIGVKVAMRPSGRTAKAESDDTRSLMSHDERMRTRIRTEQQVLAGEGKQDDC